jgi:hypothetical protein
MRKLQFTDFEKDIFIGNIPKGRHPYLRYFPESILSVIYFANPKYYSYVSSRFFYMPRFMQDYPDYVFWKHFKPNNFLRRRGAPLYLYPYLDRLNERFFDLTTVVNFEYLTVIDLNAGHGNLIKFLPQSATYLGNDIFPQGSHVVACSDLEFANLVESADVICCFGWSSGRYGVESTTQDGVLKKLISRLDPLYFVVESIIEYYELFEGIFSEVLMDFEEISKFEYRNDSRHSQRVMYIWKRRVSEDSPK